MNKLPYLFTISIGLAFAGQAVLLRTNIDSPHEGLLQALAGVLLLVSAGVFGAIATSDSSFTARFEFTAIPIPSSPSASAWRSPWILGWLAASIVLATLAVSLFVKFGESATVVFSWIAGILSLLIASMEGVRIRLLRISSQDWMYEAALAGLIAVALISRIYKLTTLPYNVDGDFASIGLQARALATGQQHNIFAYGWAGVPMLGYLPPWMTMKLFGNGLAGLNASGVVEGVLSIVGVYLLGRDLFHIRVGLIAAALLTISYSHLAASRQSSYIDPVFFLVYGIYFLLLGLREGRAWAMVASAILTALCLQMYYSGRIIIFIAGFILLFLLLFHRRWLNSHGWALLLWSLGILITLGPMLAVFARDTEALISHTRSVFILSPEIIKHMQSVYNVDTLPAMLLQQARHTVLIFHYYPDKGTQFGFARPFLDPFTAVLFTLGMGYALFHWRQLGNSLMLAWTTVGLLLGCFLTVNPPFWARLMILLPAVVLLAANALDLVYNKIHQSLQRIENRLAWVAPAMLLLVISIMGALNWNTYVNMKGLYATPRTRIARYLADQPSYIQGYLISNNLGDHDREFEFLIPNRLVASLTSEQFDSGIVAFNKSTLLILTPDQDSLVQRLPQLFPEGTVETHTGNTPDEVAFYVFRIH